MQPQKKLTRKEKAKLQSTESKAASKQLRANANVQQQIKM